MADPTKTTSGKSRRKAKKPPKPVNRRGEACSWADPAGRHRAHTEQEPETSPELLQVPDPPEPWARIWPGETITRECILFDTEKADAGWRSCGDIWVGQKAPASRYAIAQLRPPAGYRASEPADTLKARDLAWTDQQWVPVRDTILVDYVGRSVEYTRHAVARQLGSEPILCTRKNPEAGRDLPVPTGHRQLWPGEPVRRGDQYVLGNQPDAAWEPVPDVVLGTRVPKELPENDYIRFCRPVSPNHQTWYVDSSGREDALGGYDDPFPSLQTAKDVIRRMADQTGQPAYGTVLTKQGEPLLVYDLPEPEPEPETTPAEPTAEVPEPQPEKTSDPPETSPKTQTQADQDLPKPKQETPMPPTSKMQFPDLSALASTNKLAEQQIREQAARMLPPGWKILPENREAPEQALWFGPAANNPALVIWQPIPQELVGKTSAAGLLFAEKPEPPDNQLQNCFTQIAEQVQKLGELVELARQLLAAGN